MTDGVKKSNDLYLSHVNDLSLEEFVLARETYCQKMHNQLSCKQCTSLKTFAKELSKHGLVPLAESCEYCESPARSRDARARTKKCSAKFVN